MSKSRVRSTTSATVTLTIKFTNLGSWGPDCQIAQVQQQAYEAAIGRLSRLVSGHNIKVVPGTVKVEAITTELSSS